MIKYLTLSFLLILTFLQLGKTQDATSEELQFGIHRIYPPLSLSKDKLRTAVTLLDLNRHYKPAWIEAYLSVEISSSQDGVMRKALSRNDTLTQAQKKLMYTADEGSQIEVVVHYIPKNNLKKNDAQIFDFAFMVNPDHDATFLGGLAQLNQYLKQQAIDKIPPGTFREFDLTAVKFAIDETGQIMDIHVFWPSRDDVIDDLLVEAISNMSAWKPASYANGKMVKQEFVLTVGSMESCVVNLLNIRHE